MMFELYQPYYEDSCAMQLDYWNKPLLAIEGPQPLEIKSEDDIHTYHSIILNSWKFFTKKQQKDSPPKQPSAAKLPPSPILQIEDSMEIDEEPYLPLPTFSLKRRLIEDFSHKRFRPNTISVS